MKGWIREGLHPFSDDGNTSLCKSKLGGVRRGLSAYRAKAKDFFDKVKNGGVKAVILESVIAECVYVLTKIYRVPGEKAAGSLIDMLRMI